MQVLRVLGRIGVAVVASVLVLVLAAGLALVLTIRASFPDHDGAVRLPGLAASVTVHRDEFGIPQVRADSAADLFRAQGYVHAQDRFWEMDFRRHVTAGRLAELFGESQVPTDRFIRTLGWRRVAAAEYRLLSEESRGYLDAYAEGVNAWLAERDGAAVSLEYAVLGLTNPGYEIERWDPVDSLAWLKAMAWDLRNSGDEIDRSRLVTAGMPADRVAELYPAYPADRHLPITGTAGVDGAASIPDPAPDPVGPDDPAAGVGGGAGTVPVAATGALERAARAARSLDALLGPARDGLGSNSWVLAGSRTASGLPILANDPHLGPVMPSIWYQMGLRCTRVSDDCPFDVAGFTFAGLPGVVVGHNDRIAWGVTNLGPDVTDLYVERLSGDAVEVDGRFEPLDVRTETIEVAGGEPVTITIRASRHGPLISDVDETVEPLAAPPPSSPDTPVEADYAVALRWTALDPGSTQEALFAINRATDWPSFRAAASQFDVPAQNLVYADVDGHIGYQAPGVVPLRGRGDGQTPAPGWDSAYDWVGRVPYTELPSLLDPPTGMIVTANQAVADDSYPYDLGRDWAPGYRSQRLVDLLTDATAPLSVADVERIQVDAHDANAAALAPVLRRVEVDGTAGRAQELLAGWDFQAGADSAPAAFLNATWRHLLDATFTDDLPDPLPDGIVVGGGERWYEVVRGLLDDPDASWWDDSGTAEVERRDDILRRAMEDAAAELTDRLGGDPADWRWGDLHLLTIRNASLGNSGVGPVEALLNRGPYPVAGGPGIVNANGWIAPDGYEVSAVPSMRMVVDMGDLDAARWINLTGSSGHAFHPHYADQTRLWRDGRTTPWRWDERVIAEEAAATQRLDP